MTYNEFAEIARALPGVTEKIGKVENDLFRDGRHMARLRDRRKAIAFRLTWEMCDQLLASRPDLFFVSPHYQGYPYILASLEKLDAPIAEQVLRAAWSAAPEEIPTMKQARV